MIPAPICLFTYNRLEETRKTVEHLKNNFLAAESEIYIFSDGPRNSNVAPAVKAVRSYLHTLTGFKTVEVVEAETNKGLARSIIEGVSQVMETHGRVIVVEDDLLTAPNFLDFMNQALFFYRDDKAILSISGYTMRLPALPGTTDYYFSYRASSWGWATWKDRWDKVDWSVADYPQFIKDRKKRKQFNRGGSDMSRMLRYQLAGCIDSWAIRFCYHQYKHDLKTVYPTISKLVSIGFGKGATHTSGTKRFHTELDRSEKRQFNFEHFKEMDPRLVRQFAAKFSLWARAFDKIRKRL